MGDQFQCSSAWTCLFERSACSFDLRAVVGLSSLERFCNIARMLLSEVDANASLGASLSILLAAPIRIDIYELFVTAEQNGRVPFEN